MKFDLRKQALSETLVCAHRGVSGGNVPCNTLQAFEAALLQGADMIELDIAKSADDQLFVFHPGMEKAHLGIDRRLKDMPAEEILSLRFLNQDDTPTPYGISRFDDILERLKDRCYINIDKFWTCPELIIGAVRRHGMQDQVLLKSTYSEQIIRTVEAVCPNVNFMLILRDKDDVTPSMLKRHVKYIGAEVLFSSDTSPLAKKEYVRQMNESGLLVWANAIVYDYREVLSGGHNDDVSVSGWPQLGWGVLLDRGYNIIQTDWPMALKMYMTSR